jgi:hypothetical protein
MPTLRRLEPPARRSATAGASAALLRSALALAALLLAPLTASADRYRAAFGAGVVHATRGSLWGGGLSADWTLTDGITDPSDDAEWMISAVDESSYVTGTRDGGDLSQLDVLVGPRYTQVGYGRPWRLQPFAQALVGPMREAAGGSSTLLTGEFGLGLDVPLGPLHSAEGRPSAVLRAQYAKRWVNENKTDWYDQWSVSVAIRLRRQP